MGKSEKRIFLAIQIFQRYRTQARSHLPRSSARIAGNQIRDIFLNLPSSMTTTSVKPAEWSDWIDLARRREEFGKMISPLSSTTRLERWGMACRRVLRLTCLTALLVALVPANLVLVNLVGTPPSESEELGGDGRGGGGSMTGMDAIAGREGGEEGLMLSSAVSAVEGLKCTRSTVSSIFHGDGDGGALPTTERATNRARQG
ncbi:hypothetical protein ACHAW5_003948 [Stephanodiscus triporus]|uniref:Uncharacterized protein n=1 Tax=Stephanodiscus triporus TaxID=2934178 RepID=A0ABD3PYR9_9STRA